MMYRVLDDCVAAIAGGQNLDGVTLGKIHMRCAQIILGAVTEGERNPEALKRIVFTKVVPPGKVGRRLLGDNRTE
jgi:hypothetical protein